MLKSFRQCSNFNPHDSAPKAYIPTLIYIHKIILELTQYHPSSFKTLTHLLFYEFYIARYASLWKGMDFKLSEPSLALKKCCGLTTVFDTYLLVEVIKLNA